MDDDIYAILSDKEKERAAVMRASIAQSIKRLGLPDPGSEPAHIFSVLSCFPIVKKEKY